MKDIRDQAFSEATSQYPSPSTIPSYVAPGDQAMWLQNDGQRDAFRHTYWNVSRSFVQRR